MSKPRFIKANWCWWAITALCCSPPLPAGDGTTDGLGKPDAQPNRLSGQIIQTNGQPAGGATIHVRGHEQSGIDAHITADDQAHFEFVVRYPANGLGQLQVIATSQDGQQTAFHRFAWEESQRVTEGFKIQLESHRTAAVEVTDQTATWCGPCHMLSRLLDANRVWEQDYIWVKMDHRWTGAREIMAEIRDGAEGGIPWFAILDARGKKLATSNSPESGGNIGYPAEASGQVHFAHMLNATRQRMSEADVQSLLDAINNK